MTKEFEIQKLNSWLVKPLYDFFSSNGQLRLEHFYPHPFNLDYLIYLIVNRTRDFYCVLTADEKVIGYGILRGWEEGYDIPSLGIAIHKDYRGKGFGKFLMNYLHFISKLRGAEKVRLKVHKENKIAKKMYEELGYVFKDFDEEYEEGFVEL